MSVQKKACKNHPDVLTGRRCFLCKEHICRLCQHHLGGHYFCGSWCYSKWLFKTGLEKIPLSAEMRIVITLIILTNMITWLLFTNRYDRLNHSGIKEAAPLAGGSVQPDSLFFSLDTVRHAVSNELKIEIKTNPGVLIAVARDGRITESKVSGNGHVSFHNQRLNNGGNLFSIWALHGTGGSVLIDSFSVIFDSPRMEYLRRPVTRVPMNQKWIALTFDGGSLDKGSREILEILHEQDVQCTMFLTGRFIERYRDVVETIVSDGHEIGNHTFSHPHLTNLERDGSSRTRQEVNRQLLSTQLKRADSLLQITVNKRMAPYWRAPYGEINTEILLWAAEQGYKHIGWSRYCDSWDWVADTASTLYRSNGAILDHFLSLEAEQGLAGSIVLMHLGTERKNDFPYDVLAALITHLRERGYAFKTVGQLLNGQNHVL